jgi:hypothetical protein
MTVLFSAASPFAIVMAIDSALVEYVADGKAYGSTKKWWIVPRGCVGTWGSLDGNNIGSFLERAIPPEGVEPDVLADRVHEYLQSDFDPQSRGAPDVGYHVAGFDCNRAPRLFHVFWKPKGIGAKDGEYARQDQSPKAGEANLLYNGRNDVVGAVLDLLRNEVNSGSRTPVDLRSALGLLSLGHLMLRFAREVTFDVAPPFSGLVLTPDRQCQRIELPEWESVSSGKLVSLVNALAALRDIEIPDDEPPG